MVHEDYLKNFVSENQSMFLLIWICIGNLNGPNEKHNFNTLYAYNLLYVQEALTHFYSRLLFKMGHDFLDIY